MRRRVIAVLLMVCMLFAFSAQTFAASIPVKKITIEGGATIAVGATCRLKATIFPSNASNKAVTWSSSNKSIATVSSNGVVTGKKSGTVTIKVTSKSNKKISASCKITVKNVIVSGVQLDKTNYEVVGGKKFTLKASVFPSNATNKGVTWSSSNKKILTVSAKGEVTPKKKGTAYITVKTKDGGKTAKCRVTVPDVSTIRSSHTWSYKRTIYLEPFGKRITIPSATLKAVDRFTLVVDGLTGNINKVELTQDKYDVGIGVIINKDGMKVLHKNKNYVLVEAHWSANINYKLGKADVKSWWNEYKIMKDGTITITKNGFDSFSEYLNKYVK